MKKVKVEIVKMPKAVFNQVMEVVASRPWSEVNHVLQNVMKQSVEAIEIVKQEEKK